MNQRKSDGEEAGNQPKPLGPFLYQLDKTLDCDLLGGLSFLLCHRVRQSAVEFPYSNLANLGNAHSAALYISAQDLW